MQSVLPVRSIDPDVCSVLDLVHHLRSFDMILVEGIRSSGKSYVCNRLGELFDKPVYATWKMFGGLKSRIQASVGTVQLQDCGVDITQANVFAIECAAQINPKCIFDRTYFSSMQFNDEVDTNRLATYYTLLRNLNVCILYVHAQDVDQLPRIQARGLSWDTVQTEKSRYDAIFSRIPEEINLLCQTISVENRS
jgi:thymidylate kinase